MSDELKITKNNAISAYYSACDSGRKILETLFGKETFSGKITDRIRTMRDVYEYHGVKESDVLIQNVHPALANHLISINGYIKLILMTQALNENRIPNWDNGEYKYYGWWKMKSGFGFSTTSYGNSTDTGVGSRLLFLSLENQEHAAKYFPEEYRQYMEYTK